MGAPGPGDRILILRLGKLGDMMVTACLIQALRRTLPGARLGLVTLPRSMEFSRALPGLDEVHAWRSASLPWLAFRLRGRWDWMVDLNELPSTRSGLAFRLFGPLRTAAFRSANTAADLVMDAPPMGSSHVIERMAAAARALGLSLPASEFAPFVPLDPSRLSAARRNSRKSLTVGLNLSAGSPTRYWPQDRWKRLASALLEADKGVTLQIIHDRRDRALARGLAERLPADRLRPVSGHGLWDFAADIASNRLLITPDTAAVHAASAFGVRVVGLYPEPAWNLASWGPWGAGHVALKSPSGGVEGLALETVQTAALRALRAVRRQN